jgi:hypothetical protein
VLARTQPDTLVPALSDVADVSTMAQPPSMLTSRKGVPAVTLLNTGAEAILSARISVARKAVKTCPGTAVCAPAPKGMAKLISPPSKKPRGLKFNVFFMSSTSLSWYY